MDSAQLVIAFTAGALAFLSPCSLPMLPVYVSYAFERGGRSLLSGLALSISMVAGFLAVFLAIGLISSLIVSGLLGFIWLAEPVIGGGLIVFGMLAGWTKTLDKFPTFSSSADGNRLSFLFYGIAYGVASLGCSLPVFLLIVLQGAETASLFDALTLFAAYGAGAATLIVPLTLSLTLANEILHEKLLGLLPYMKRINGAVLIVAGAYMVYSGLIR